jgi:hypothetical protein
MAISGSWPTAVELAIGSSNGWNFWKVSIDGCTVVENSFGEDGANTADGGCWLDTDATTSRQFVVSSACAMRAALRHCILCMRNHDQCRFCRHFRRGYSEASARWHLVICHVVVHRCAKRNSGSASTPITHPTPPHIHARIPHPHPPGQQVVQAVAVAAPAGQR